MNDEKILMSEAAALYYGKNMTQQEIAAAMGLSRQTVSRLLGDAVREGVVEIIIHDPQKDCQQLQEEICAAFGIRKCIVCRVSSKNGELHRFMAVRAAADYLLPMVEKGGLKIAVSWGRTVRELVDTFPQVAARGNVVFPLFGATDHGSACFSSNELARSLADRIGAELKCAWFPYKADSGEDHALIRRLSYYRKMEELWNSADLAVMGIGNREMLELFGKTFGYGRDHGRAVGDVATHFFNGQGEFVDLYENTLCASAENIRNARESVAIACGEAKAEAIAGALRTGLIDTLVTDEHTARQVLRFA